MPPVNVAAKYQQPTHGQLWPTQMASIIAGSEARGETMLTVMCFDRVSGMVKVLVPLRFRTLVSRYAQWECLRLSTAYDVKVPNQWVTDTEYRTWLQLPGVTVER